MKQSAVVVIFNASRSEVLLIKRRDVPVWVFPGGGIDAGESPDAAAIREALEETGFKVEIFRKIGEYMPLNRLSRKTHLYECRIISGQAFKGTETKDIAFFPLDKLPEPFFILHQDWLLDALRNSDRVIYKNIERITYTQLFFHFLKHPIHVIRIILSRLGYPINSKD